MSGLRKTVVIFGGSGFVGRYVARRMARLGWYVRVAVRRPNEALFVRTYGEVGQVEPVLANVRDEDSTRAAISGTDAVINCVGLMQESGKQNFEAVHVEAAGRIARLALSEGAAHLVHLSALSADEASESRYASSKARGEAAVKSAFPDAMILRPSVVFGFEDHFFNRFARLARYTLVLPLVGAETMFQPVYVDDVARAAAMGAAGDAAPGVYELGGPVARSFRNLMRGMLRVIERRRMIVNMPFRLAYFNAWWFDFWTAAIGHLYLNRILTRDQVRLLRTDDVVSEDARKLSDLGIEPTPMEAVLETYLYCHRPEGQFTAIRDSAKTLSKV